MFIYIQIAYLLICITEAWLEQAVIYLKNPKVASYDKWNKREHVRSAVYAVGVGIALASFPPMYGDVKTGLMLLPVILSIRRIGFDFALKKFRGRKVKIIEGDQFTDKIARWLFTKNGGWLDMATMVLLTAAVNYMYQL